MIGDGARVVKAMAAVADVRILNHGNAFRCYAHFLLSSSKPALARSSGVITMWSSQSALKLRNQGSANDGTSDGSSTSMIMMAPRPSVLRRVDRLRLQL